LSSSQKFKILLIVWWGSRFEKSFYRQQASRESFVCIRHSSAYRIFFLSQQLPALYLPH